MSETIKALSAITRAPISIQDVSEALGWSRKVSRELCDIIEALERFELIKVNRLHPYGHLTATVYLTDLGAERVIESLIGAGQELPPGLVKPPKPPGKPRGRVPKASLITKPQPPAGKRWLERKGVDWNMENR